MADDSACRHHNRRQTPYQLKIASLSALPGPERKDETYAGRHTGATTAEKSEGTSGGVDDNLLSFLLHPFPVSRYCSTHVSPIPFPILLSFSPFKFSQVFGSTVSFLHCPAIKNGSQLQKLEGTKYTWSPLSARLDGTRPTGPVVRLRLWLPRGGGWMCFPDVGTIIVLLYTLSHASVIRLRCRQLQSELTAALEYMC